MKHSSSLILYVLICVSASLEAQIMSFPYSESFDNVEAPALPVNWSFLGFTTNASVFRSSPNCVSTTGNTTAKSITSPALSFTNRMPGKLVFWERRSSTAAAYRLEVCASLDGANFDKLLSRFDTIPSTSEYIQRSIDLTESGLIDQSPVWFQWQLLGDNSNNTGVLRIDDVLLTVAPAVDVGFTNMAVSPTHATRKDVLTISATVKNYGPLFSSGFSIRFFRDENFNNFAEPNEQFAITEVLALQAGDSLVCTANFVPIEAREHRFIAVVDFSSDENPMNDTGYTAMNVGSVPADILINEIMYEPLNDQHEWFELYNRSTQLIDLACWTFHDRPTFSGTNSFVITDQTIIVRPGEYALVAADSTILQLFPHLLLSDSSLHTIILHRAGGFSFNNDGDEIVLKDPTGQTIDNVAYSPCWHHPDVVDTRGRSLERINPNINSNDSRNWSTCVHALGGTPGKTNSVMTINSIHRSAISLSPNPFSPDGDGFEDFCCIHYHLPMIASMLQVKIYDIKGRLIRTLVRGELAGPEGEIIWNGLDDYNQRARIGVYVVYLEATDRASGKTESSKSVVVVALRF